MRRIINWLTIEGNRGAALALLTLVTALLGGGWFLYDRLVTSGDGSPAGAGSVTQTLQIDGGAGVVQQVGPDAIGVTTGDDANVTINKTDGYTIAQHEAALARREGELRADLERAHVAEKDVLLTQLDEVRRQRADADGSYAARKAELARAMAKLDEVAFGLPEVRLGAARKALAEGDTAKADAIFAEVEAMESAAIERGATAAFERGKLAEADIRWADAAEHYAKAARLAPSYDHLLKARTYAWRSGNYRAALLYGEDLVAAAVAQEGEGSKAHATALNDHAQTLDATSQYVEAEPLFRKALAIGEKTLGKANATYGNRLNNLAELLRKTGRFEEAEPLYREALAIDEKTLGNAHPDYAIHLNNLGVLLRDTGRFDEAEPLYREALAIGEKTLGRAHPSYAVRLNNLGVLLRQTGRDSEAEPLYREALVIREKALGKEHPNYAESLNNLAMLLSHAGRDREAEPLYREALAIDEKILGNAHPDYAIYLNNLAGLLRRTGRAEETEPLYREALAILTAKLGVEHPTTKTVAANLQSLGLSAASGPAPN